MSKTSKKDNVWGEISPPKGPEKNTEHNEPRLLLPHLQFCCANYKTYTPDAGNVPTSLRIEDQ